MNWRDIGSLVRSVSNVLIVTKVKLVFINIIGTNKAPDVDTEIDIRNAKEIAIQVDATSDTNHTATDWDLNIITSPVAGGTYDTTPYQEWNFLNDAVETLELPTGPAFMKLRLDENGSLRADVTVTVTVKT